MLLSYLPFNNFHNPMTLLLDLHSFECFCVSWIERYRYQRSWEMVVFFYYKGSLADIEAVDLCSSIYQPGSMTFGEYLSASLLITTYHNSISIVCFDSRWIPHLGSATRSPDFSQISSNWTLVRSDSNNSHLR